jgi:predicted lipoprotein with Yx(FWY)xxD motif
MGGRRVHAARRVRRAALAGLFSGGLVLLAGGCAGTDADTADTAAAGPSAGSSGSSAASPSASPAGSSATSATSPDASSTSAPQPGVVIRTGGSAYGRMLFDGRRQAIYLFDREGSTRPRCYGECAEAWPPVLADGEAQPRGGVRAGLLGTVERRDGSVQVTYGGHPLYYYAHEGPGQVLCHDIVEYGGTWLVVTPRGEPAPA